MAPTTSRVVQRGYRAVQGGVSWQLDNNQDIIHFKSRRTMSQQSEEAEAVPNVPTMEQMAQMVQMLAAREVVRLRVSDRARTRSPDPEPQIDVEVALLNKGAKSVSARPSWAEMRRAVMQ